MVILIDKGVSALNKKFLGDQSFKLPFLGHFYTGYKVQFNLPERSPGDFSVCYGRLEVGLLKQIIKWNGV